MEPPPNLLPPASSASKRPVKFVASDEDGLPLKRRQVQQACDSCRRKKKRCPHGIGSASYSFIQDGPPQKPVWTSPPQYQHQHKHPGQHQQPKQSSPRQPLPLTANSNATATTTTTSNPGRSRLPLSPESSEQNEEASSAALVASQLVELSASRFVGDLSPESVFIEATNKNAAASRLHRNRSEVGTWMREAPAGCPSPGAVGQHGGGGGGREDDGTSSRSNGGGGGGGVGGGDGDGAYLLPEPPLLTLGGRLQIEQQPPPSVTRAHLAVCPPDREYRHLHDIYLENIHPILPILREADVLATRGAVEGLSIRQVVLKQVISLTAAVDPCAARYLRLGGGDGAAGADDDDAALPPLLAPEVFHQRLSKAIFAALDTGFVVHTVDRIRVLLLMSLFYQPRRAADRDVSPLIFSQAVHHAQSIGVHLRRGGGSGGDNGDDEEDAEGLFCALTALDRINAAFHGRPCLLHRRDTDRELDDCIANQRRRPAFRLFLRVCGLLDSVICLYRPRNDGVESVELPVYETMIVDAGAEKLPSRLLSTIEVFYHAVSILSCRESSGPGPSAAPPPPTPSTHAGHIPPPTINARRSLSADRIMDSVLSSLANPGASDSVFLLPFVPYAVALSLSVVYLKMRHSRIPMYRFRAKQRFREIVALLHTLGTLYTSARVNAGLGAAILREMDKTAKELAGGSGSGGGGGGAVMAGGHVSAQAQAQQTHQGQAPAPGRAPAPGMASGSSSTPGRLESRVASPAQLSGVSPLAAAERPQQHHQQHQQQQKQLHLGEEHNKHASPQVPRPPSEHPHGSSHQFPQAAAPSLELSQRQQQQADAGAASMIPSSLATVQQTTTAAAAASNPQAATAANAVFPAAWSDISPDIDLFVHFDPGFDLGAVDAALEANLDMGYPQLWTIPWPE